MYININDIALYYEEAGAGKPLILLHGNGEGGHIFKDAVDKLKSSYRVFTVDSRGQGMSGPGIVSYDAMAEDIIGFIRAMKLEKPVLYGFSDGGIIGLLIAIRQKTLLSKLIVSGINTNPSGIKKGFLLMMRAGYFLGRNPLVKLMLTAPDIKEEELKSIEIPVVYLAGQRDMIKTEHTKAAHAATPGSKLFILRGENHSSYVYDSSKLLQAILPHLD